MNVHEYIHRNNTDETWANHRSARALSPRLWISSRKIIHMHPGGASLCRPDLVLLNEQGDWLMAIECKRRVDLNAISHAMGQCLLYKRSAPLVGICVPTGSRRSIPSFCREIADQNGIHVFEEAELLSLAEHHAPDALKRITDPAFEVEYPTETAELVLIK
jgi:hypothetical protein